MKFRRWATYIWQCSTCKAEGETVQYLKDDWGIEQVEHLGEVLIQESLDKWHRAESPLCRGRIDVVTDATEVLASDPYSERWEDQSDDRRAEIFD